jgi:DNA mismatch repair protein MutS
MQKMHCRGESSVEFGSILFDNPQTVKDIDHQEAPQFFRDLNLDQIVDEIIADWKEYNLAPFFYLGLKEPATISYRQEVIQDLADAQLADAIGSFCLQMRAMRERLKQAKDLCYKYAIERAFLGAVAIYCQATQRLEEELKIVTTRSSGLNTFKKYLNDHVTSEPFQHLATDAEQLITGLSAVRYCLVVKDDSITVRAYEEETDYSVAVEETFERFRQEKTTEHHVKFPVHDGINHIQAQILDGVARLYPEIFRGLDRFSAEHADYLDSTVARFDREIHFYIAYLRYIERFRSVGLSFCLPQLLETSKAIRVRESFDLALASKLIHENVAVIPNDFTLDDPERVFVVTGPNQGGKTTFARMLGQLHYFASLGCPVPGKCAHLFLYDQLFVHFEREEDINNLRGKLHDDLVRIRHILDQATPTSIVILNEIFSSTTLQDALYLSKKIMTRIADLDLIAVWVTFLDELASSTDTTVSLVGTVDPYDPAIRTYKLERRPANGLAYAHAIAEKYRVTYECLKERIVA